MLNGMECIGNELRKVEGRKKALFSKNIYIYRGKKKILHEVDSLTSHRGVDISRTEIQ